MLFLKTTDLKPNTMKNIIVPVDFSIHSEYALRVAASIAKKFDADLFLLHMLDLSEQLISETDATERREILYFTKLIQKRFDEFTGKDYMKGVKSTPIIKKEKVFREVQNTAKELNADLIVMGSRGAEGMKGFFVGSNTSKVVQTADIPVLVVKEKQIDFAPRQIIFASDFAPENFAAFQKVKSFAALFNAHLKLVFVNTPNLNFSSTQEIREKMRQFLNQMKLPINSADILIYNDYTVSGGILNAAKDNKADMIAIPTHGRTGFNKVLSGNISGDVANQSGIPVLTIKV